MPPNGPVLPVMDYPDTPVTDTAAIDGKGDLDSILVSIPEPVLLGAEFIVVLKALQEPQIMNMYTAVAVAGGYLMYKKVNM